MKSLLAATLWLLAARPADPTPALQAPVHEVQTRSRVIAFSFDDGPSPQDTLRISAVLRAGGAHATFFMTGIMVQENPGAVRRLCAAGMEIGNHGMRHRFLRGMPAPAVEQEVTDGERAIEQAGGPRPHLYRLPGGIGDRTALATLSRLGYRVIGWSVDPRDWRPHASAAAVARCILRDAAPGRIVVLHDGPGSREATLTAVRAVLPALRARGYRVVAVGDLLKEISPSSGGRTGGAGPGPEGMADTRRGRCRGA